MFAFKNHQAIASHLLIPGVLFCLVCNLTKVLADETWPAFRGTNQGHASSNTTVPLTWAPDQNIRWKTPVNGKAWSSPIAVRGVGYITTAVETKLPTPPETKDETKPDSKKADPNSTLSLRASAVDLSNGKILWDKEIFEAKAVRIHKKNSHASPTPIFEDGKVYVHFGHHGTACLEAKSGEIIWSQNGHSYLPVHGSGSSPVIVGDKLVYSADGKSDPCLIALNKADGTLAWKKIRDVEAARKFSFATPLVIEVNGKSEIISPCSGAVISYDPENGDEIWKCRYGTGYSVTPRPVYAHGLIYVSSGFDRAIAYAIKPDGAGDVTDTNIVWSHTKSVPRESSFIVVGDEFYMNNDTGFLTCLDAKSGEVHYSERINPEGGYSSSPVYASGHLFFINGEGVTTVIKPGKSFEKVGENRIGEYGLSSLAVLKDGFLHRTEKHLFRIGG